jgi:hypothetical protein
MSMIREVCRIIDVRYELMLTSFFAVISGTYILYRYGFNELIDELMRFLFPASMVILITLVFLLLMERVYLPK